MMICTLRKCSAHRCDMPCLSFMQPVGLFTCGRGNYNIIIRDLVSQGTRLLVPERSEGATRGSEADYKA